MRRTWWLLGSGGLAVAAAVALAVPVFACTALPSVNLSQLYGPAGTTLQMTGANWVAAQGPVSVRWDRANGPLLATAVPDAAGNIGPVTVTVPEQAATRFHVLIAAAGSTASVARTVFQVNAPNGSSAGAPQAVLPAAGPSQATAALSAGMIGLIVALGIAGLVLVGVGGGVLVGGLGRRSAAGSVHRR